MPSYVILSCGRSGSVLLAHNVGKTVGLLPTYVNWESELTSEVVHTHLTLPANKFSGYQRIFSLRSDPVETALSFAIARHYNTYHKFSNQVLPTPKPFLVDLNDIKKYCEQIINWHQYYSKQLTTCDVVIVYEQMIKILTTSVYDQIYPNKATLLLNYSQAKLTCQQYQLHMLHSIAPFLLHRNTQDVRDYINYSE